MQVKPANTLLTDRRSPVDIETGEHMCGEPSSILLLIHMGDADPFLQELKQELALAYSQMEVFA